MADPPPAPKVFKDAVPRAAPGNYDSIAAQYERARAAEEKEDQERVGGILGGLGLSRREGRGKEEKGAFERLNEVKERRFRGEWLWVVGFWVWLL